MADTAHGSVNPSTAAATTLLDELVRHGVRHVVACPGSRSTALVLAAARTAGLTLHMRLDERSAAFTALGIGRATGLPAVVVTTSGTAVANLVPAACEAAAAGVPWLAVTANRPAERHDVGANQTLRQADLLAPVVRWQVRLAAATGHPGEPALWRTTAGRAVAIATGVGGGTPADPGSGGGAGPVHVDLAFREPTVPGLDDGRSTAAAYGRDTAGRAHGAPWTAHVGATSDVTAVVAELAARLAGRRVLVVAGDVPVPIARLDDLPWPVVAEPTAAPTLAAGLAHGSLLVADRGPAARPPDVVLRLGHPTLSRPALVGLADVPTIQVDGSGLVDPARRAVTAITAPPHEVVDLLADVVAARDADVVPDVVATWCAAWDRADARAADVVAATLDGAVGDAGPDLEPTVARLVARAVGDRRLVVASSLPIRDVADWAGNVATGRVHANRGLAGIDGLVATASGVALGGGPTVALVGDLSFLHDHNGLLVPPGEQVPDLDVVVVDNDGGGLFHHVPAAGVAGFERLFATPHGRDLAAVAAAAGADAAAVGAADLAARIASPPGGLRVTVVRTDRRASVTARTALRERIAAT